MTERYNVQASTILGENYKITNIECSDYNPNIDTYITVTITVNDVYGDAISDESVTVTASEGNFTQLNGSSITAAATVTGTTNSSGQFTLTYTCSEWGLITFVANNTNIQVNVIGFKSQSLGSGTLYYDNEKVEYVLNYHSTVTWQINNAWTDSGAFNTIPSELRPKHHIYSMLSDTRMALRVNRDTGKVQTSNSAQIDSPYIQCVLTWYLP